MSKAYVGIKPCGCITAVMLDDEHTTATEVAKFAADLAKTGRRIEHREWDGKGFPYDFGCKCDKSPVQEPLIANSHR